MTSKRSSRRAPAQAAAEVVESQPEVALDSPSAGCVAESKPVDRYLAQIDGLCEDAARHDAIGVLVDVMAWYLARIATSRTDPTMATADIGRIFTSHVCDLIQQQRVKAEAERAKAEGAAVH